MGCDVYANGDEIACKAGAGKVLAAFPDVCLSPPSPPAGPIPVPYPDTSFSKDMMNGSKTVKIKNQEVMLKDQSFYKTAPLGDEAATQGLGAGVITHVITGKTYFVMWSMDVKIEGQNVDRHLDITTSNHASVIANEAVPLGNLADATDFRDFKATVKWGHKRTPAICAGTHDWECNKKMCPDCWNPACDPNAKREQEEYEESQKGTSAERAEKGKAQNRKKIAAGEDPVGNGFENQAIDKVAETSKIKHTSYYAHCKKCHTQAQIDIVTEDSVIECKHSASLVKKKQLEERIIPVAKKCFPGKQVKVLTRATELPALNKKLGEAEYAPLGVSGMDP